MNVEMEIKALTHHVVATQIVVGQLLLRLSRASPEMREMVIGIFETSADIAQSTAIIHGDPAEALRVIEEMRMSVFGNTNSRGGAPP